MTFDLQINPYCITTLWKVFFLQDETDQGPSININEQHNPDNVGGGVTALLRLVLGHLRGKGNKTLIFQGLPVFHLPTESKSNGLKLGHNFSFFETNACTCTLNVKQSFIWSLRILSMFYVRIMGGTWRREEDCDAHIYGRSLWHVRLYDLG